MSLEDVLKIPVQCPHCSKEFEQRLSALQAGNNVIRCALCSREFTLEITGDDPQEPTRALRQLERTLNRFAKKLR